MDTLEEHFTNQRDAINVRLDRCHLTEAEDEALRAHAATLDGVIKLLAYVTARRDESATEQDNGKLSLNERTMHRHKCVAYGNVVGAIRQCFGVNTGKKHVAYIDVCDENGAFKRYATNKGASTTALALAARFDTAEEARADLDHSNDYWAKNGKILEVDESPAPDAQEQTTGPSIE